MRLEMCRQDGGINMLEVMMVFAVVTISLNAGWPSLRNMAIRAKVSEAMNQAEGVKRDITILCSENSADKKLNNLSAGDSALSTEFVREITLTGTCAETTIAVFTQNTGASTDPVLHIVGSAPGFRGRNSGGWACAGEGLAAHLPESCRQQIKQTAVSQ